MTAAADKGEKGEGNYKAAKAYQDDAHAFASDKANVEARAKEAAGALDNAEGEELRKAEAEARDGAKS